jgi:hypothetical protein
MNDCGVEGHLIVPLFRFNVRTGNPVWQAIRWLHGCDGIFPGSAARFKSSGARNIRAPEACGVPHLSPPPWDLPTLKFSAVVARSYYKAMGHL